MRLAYLLKSLSIMTLLWAVTTVSSAKEHNAHQHTQNLHEQNHEAESSEGLSSPFEKDLSQAMLKMMADMHAPGYTGNRDIDFLQMMIPHHEGAIEMAKLLLIHGNDALTRSLAREVIASQQTEIEAMKARLAILKAGGQSQKVDEYPALNGTRGNGEKQVFD